MTGGKVRVTVHSGRMAENSKHNDRQFDTSKSDHINPALSSNNVYWQWNMDPNTGERPGTFEEAEEEFYREHFSVGLEEKNKRYRKNGHSEKCRTLDAYRKAMHSRPEETIFMIGDKDADIPPETLWQIVGEHLAWKREKLPQNITLDVALHVDEAGGPHVHERAVWIGHDDDGHEVVVQQRALAEMGITRPRIDEPESKNNNSKMVYTQMCREHFIEVCKQHGIDVEEVPKEASKTGLSLIQYQFNQEAEKLERVALENGRLVSENERLTDEIKIGHDELERTMTQKIEASKIKHHLGDKERESYHKDSLVQARNIATEARKDREAAERYFVWAASDKREAEKLKADYETGDQLKAEYEEKLSKLDDRIEARAKEIAGNRFQAFIEHNSQPDRTRAMEAFMDEFTYGKHSLLDEFNERYDRELEEYEREWDDFDIGD